MQRKPTNLLKRIRNNLRLPESQHDDDELRKERLDQYQSQVVSAYTLGGLALAAWAVLAATNTSNRLALGLLGVTVITSAGCPILFRIAQGEATRMGFESALAVAGLSLVAAMLSLEASTFGDGYAVLAAYLVSAVLFVREVGESIGQMILTAHEVLPATRRDRSLKSRSG